MIVSCKNCRTRFRLEPHLLGPEGRSVRCSRCGMVFLVKGPQPAKRTGPPPGVSDDDYVLYGDAAPVRGTGEAAPPPPPPPPQSPSRSLVDILAEKVRGARHRAEARPAPQVRAEPQPPRPPEPAPTVEPVAAPTPVAAAATRPQPAPQVSMPEPAPPAPEPEPLDLTTLAQPAPEATTPGEAAGESEPAEATPEAAQPAKTPAAPLEEPWPEATRPVAFGPPPPPRAVAAQTGLAGLRARLTRSGPKGKAALVMAAVLVLGLMAWRMGFIGGENVDPEGKARISFTGISGYFLKNDQDGIIYVVQGLARNGYSESRGKIRIKAAIYDKTGDQVRQGITFAGNVFTRDELQRVPLKDIEDRLGSAGREGKAQAVNPGSTVPFMAVFGDLPDSLSEFSLEAAGSSSSSS